MWASEWLETTKTGFKRAIVDSEPFSLGLRPAEQEEKLWVRHFLSPNNVCIHNPAVASPGDSSGISVAEIFSGKLKTLDVFLVPATFELSGDPNKVLGEEAEKKVIDSIEKCGRDIPGIKIICFHGIQVIGCPSLGLVCLYVKRFYKAGI